VVQTRKFRWRLLGVMVAGLVILAASGNADSLTQTSDGNWAFSSSSSTSQEYGGWFFNGDNSFLYPAASDSSQPWTSASNLATMNAWLSLVTAAAGDPAALAALEGLGTTGWAMPTAPSNQLANLSSQQVAPNGAPEPALLSLLGGGIVVLGILTTLRIRGIG